MTHGDSRELRLCPGAGTARSANSVRGALEPPQPVTVPWHQSQQTHPGKAGTGKAAGSCGSSAGPGCDGPGAGVPLFLARPLLFAPKYPGTDDFVHLRAVPCEVWSPASEPWESGNCSHLPGLGLGQSYILASKSAFASDTGEKKSPGRDPAMQMFGTGRWGQDSAWERGQRGRGKREKQGKKIKRK